MAPRSPQQPSSPELGSGDFAVTYNERTGRPIRKSAGRRSYTAVPVDPTDSEDMLSDFTDADADDDDVDANSDNEWLRSRLPAHSKQQLRPLEPLPLHVTEFPVVRDEFDAICDPTAGETRVTPGPGPEPAALCLTFNIPLGFEGPLKVEIPRQALSPSYTTAGTPAGLQSAFSSHHPTCRPNDSVGDAQSWGWSDIPAELRNRVYRFLFVQVRPLSFDEPTNFCCSSQFLRTCKQVHSEGREILYSENSFCFERNKLTRAPYWAYMPKEIGFKDVRLFLTCIGQRSVSMLRDVTFICDDAMPSSTRELTNEERRFTHDPNLIECLRILGRHGRLRRFQISFHGRRNLLKTDDRFLVALRAVRADAVKVIDHPRWKTYDGSAVVNSKSKLSYALKNAIEQTLTRKKKLWQV